MYGHPDAVSDAVSDSVRVAIYFFVNFKSLYLSQN